MPRAPEPWWRDDRNAWFVTINGKRHNLGPDRKEADRQFHELMAKKDDEPKAPPKSEGLAIIEVFDKFQDWCQKHRAGRTYDWYHDHIQNFLNHVGDLAKCPVTDLKPFHVVEWVDSHTDWGSNYRRGAIIAIQRPFNWAEELGYIPATPIKKIPKPTPTRRESFIRPDDWEKIKTFYTPGDPFRDILEFAWESGCRPQEAKKLEARHVDLEHHIAAFPKEEAKGKKCPRFIRLTPKAEEILKKCLQVNPDGILFRNEDGNPWTKDAMNCRFVRLKKHLGVKFATYDFRHGFCQDLLEQGNNTNAVAELMGHADSRMIDKNYSHMHQANSHLDRILQRRHDNHGKEK